MRAMGDVSAFRSSKGPFLTFWSVGNTQAYGSLIWLDDKPILTLSFEVDEESAVRFDKADIPILNDTKPPLQPTISGSLTKFGAITLENCARYNVRVNHNLQTGRAIYELDFLPTSVWMGNAKVSVGDNVRAVLAGDTRLAGFFGAPGLINHRKFDPETATAFEALNNPDTIWAMHGPAIHEVQIGETGWLLSLYTSALESVSAVEGHSLKSTVRLELRPPKPTSIEEASQMLRRLEEMLSTFCIEPFTFQFEEYEADPTARVFLVWRLGENQSLFQSPMRHQILLDLSNPVTLRHVCKEWFQASSTVNLSRWLFVRALRETEDGLARFVAVAQAFEVLGRELGPHDSMPKSRLREAVKLVRDGLQGKFEEAFVDRIAGLMGSSNRSSYRDVLCHMIGGAVVRLKLGSDDEIAQFSKLVADTRNAVVHMTDNDKGQLNEAFSRINKLSL